MAEVHPRQRCTQEFEVSGSGVCGSSSKSNNVREPDGKLSMVEHMHMRTWTQPVLHPSSPFYKLGANRTGRHVAAQPIDNDHWLSLLGESHWVA